MIRNGVNKIGTLGGLGGGLSIDCHASFLSGHERDLSTSALVLLLLLGLHSLFLFFFTILYYISKLQRHSLEAVVRKRARGKFGRGIYLPTNKYSTNPKMISEKS